MNFDSYDDSIFNWQPPSPRRTPHLMTPLTFDLKTSHNKQSSYSQQHGSAPSPAITTSSLSSTQAAASEDRPPSSSSLKRSRTDSLQGMFQGSPANNHPTLLPMAPTIISDRSLSHSFLEQFDNTNIRDSFPSSQPATVTPTRQMRTPPPTRDATSRKINSQNRAMSFTTPSSVASRRLSAPGDQPLQKQETLPSDISPFQFTPFQYSPLNATPFSNMGPMTAPEFPQSGLFWDPNGDFDLTKSFPVSNEDPFSLSIPSASTALIQQTQYVSNGDPGFRGISKRHSAALQIDRPQSARPADLTRINTSTSFASSPLGSASSVNPSMLLASQRLDSLISNNNTQYHGQAVGGAYQPYQYQMEQLKREKELDRKRREARSRPAGRNNGVSTPGRAEAGLRRSLTDSKTRTANFNLQKQFTQSSPMDKIDPDLIRKQLHVPRESSPLKRHKSYAQDMESAWKPPHARKSVVLTVDESGHASTQVKQLVEDKPVTNFSGELRRGILSEDSDDSDSEQETPRPRHRLNDDDAESALFAVLQERMNRRAIERRNEMMPHYTTRAVSSCSSGERAGWDDSESSNASMNRAFLTPIKTTATRSSKHRDARMPAPARCICKDGKNSKGALVIQCDLCNEYYHITCLGLDSQNLPQTFRCLFCVDGAKFTREDHEHFLYGD